MEHGKNPLLLLSMQPSLVQSSPPCRRGWLYVAPPLRKPHPVCTMTAMRAVAPAADEEVDTQSPPLQVVWKPCCSNWLWKAVRLHKTGSWLGALVSALCCVASQAHRLRYGSFVILVCLVDVCHTNLMGDTMLSSSQYVSIPVNWPADHHRAVVVCCLVGFCFGFCVLCVFGFRCCLCWFPCCFTRWRLYGLCIDPPKLLLMHIVVMMMLPLP